MVMMSVKSEVSHSTISYIYIYIRIIILASSLHNAKPQSDLISSHASETCPRNLGCCKCEDQTNPDSARLVIDDKFDDARKESSSFEGLISNFCIMYS